MVMFALLVIAQAAPSCMDGCKVTCKKDVPGYESGCPEACHIACRDLAPELNKQ
ncbi:hypothetical protein CCACVL1_05306 [Corchorus capsularis]|uniref:Uncharacterized protein n=1 Tax=Corchorus capsularis TaxID=210143 RepID=A0A1R3JLE5_COCAP|nr:hypothetical protein CCACVL1_05306 [Corchorus capsularis]